MKRGPGDENVARNGGLPLDEAESFARGLSDRDRLAVAAFVFEGLRRNWHARGSYRAMLAELGFEAPGDVDAYRVLMAAGALEINNALPDDPPSRDIGER